MDEVQKLTVYPYRIVITNIGEICIFDMAMEMKGVVIHCRDRPRLPVTYGYRYRTPRLSRKGRFSIHTKKTALSTVSVCDRV